VRRDKDTKLCNTYAERYLEESIKHEFSTPYTPQQNGVAERKNRTLIDMARTMLDEVQAAAES
jgi:transposase InsO family protein